MGEIVLTIIYYRGARAVTFEATPVIPLLLRGIFVNLSLLPLPRPRRVLHGR